MTRRLLPACVLALGIALVLPAPARAGDVKLAIRDGRVTLSAHDATLRQILAEWERVGGTRVFNRDRTPGTLLTIELTDVVESQALATLMRSAAGYAATERLDPSTGASRYSRIVVMPGEAAPWASTASVPAVASGSSAGPGAGPGGGFGARAPGQRTPMQRRVLPDGRVVMGVSDGSEDAGDDADEPPQGSQPGMLRPPFWGPSRSVQGQSGDEPTRIDAGDEQATPAAPRYTPAPGPGTSGTMPGMVPARTLPSTPIKPPGD